MSHSLIVLAVANKCLNETTELVGDIKCPHSKVSNKLQIIFFDNQK